MPVTAISSAVAAATLAVAAAALATSTVAASATVATAAVAAATKPVTAPTIATDPLPAHRCMGAARQPERRLGRVRHRPDAQQRPDRQRGDRGTVLHGGRRVQAEGDGQWRLWQLERRLHRRDVGNGDL